MVNISEASRTRPISCLQEQRSSSRFIPTSSSATLAWYYIKEHNPGSFPDSTQVYTQGRQTGASHPSLSSLLAVAVQRGCTWGGVIGAWPNTCPCLWEVCARSPQEVSRQLHAVLGSDSSHTHTHTLLISAKMHVAVEHHNEIESQRASMHTICSQLHANAALATYWGRNHTRAEECAALIVCQGCDDNLMICGNLNKSVYSFTTELVEICWTNMQFCRPELGRRRYVPLPTKTLISLIGSPSPAERE